MRNNNSAGHFPLGLLMLSLGLAAYKAAFLSMEMTGSLAVFAELFVLDLSFLGLLGLLCVVHALIAGSVARSLFKALLALVVAFYIINSFVLLELDEYMNLFDLARYLPEPQVVFSFFDALIIGVVLVYMIAVLLNRRIKGTTLAWLSGFALIALISGVVATRNAPYQLQKYGLLQLDALATQLLSRPSASSYSPGQIDFYAALGAAPVEFIRPEPNIILLVVESLSSINSHKVSGERDLLGQFDTLAGQGVLFRNFFANHAASEGGIIALLSGIPPLHYPTATPLMFDEFSLQPSVIGEYRAQGYFTEFLTNADLGFIGMDRYLAGLNFDLARGRDEVPAMLGAPRIVQDAPSDRYLYREALDRITQLSGSGRPWFLTLATVSTHLPYGHPEGDEDSAEAVWEWSLDRLIEFCHGLQEKGFFENGILLVTGDHRQMRPLTDQETARYGDSARARIPLLALGANLPAGRIDDRFFQQSDLLRYLERINQPGLELSPYPIWVERYNRIYGKVESINRFSVFSEADQGLSEFPVRVSGNQLTWLEEKPWFSRSMETFIHAQRSRHQFNRVGIERGCAPNYGHAESAPSARQGLHWSSFQEVSINSLLESVQAVNQGIVTDQLSFTPGALSASGSLLWFRGFLEIEKAGLYWFRTAPGNRACLGINGEVVLDQLRQGAGTQTSIKLEAGPHTIDVRFLLNQGAVAPALQWVTPGLLRWRWRDVPGRALRIPSYPATETGSPGTGPDEYQQEQG